jgi:DNA-binding CsgD family transcriptional regulator
MQRPRKTHGYNPALTRREQQVLELSANGFTNQQMADILCLSFETIKDYKRRILRKTDAFSIAHAVALSAKSGTLCLDNVTGPPTRSPMP